MLGGRHLARFSSILLAIGISVVSGSSFAVPAMAASVPPNDFFAFATDLSSSVPYTESNIDNTSATKETKEPGPTCSQGINNTIWYRYVASTATTLTAGAVPSPYVGNTIRPYIAVYDGTAIDALTQVACAGPGSTQAVYAPFPVEVGHTYYVQVGAYCYAGCAPGKFTFTISGPRSTVTLYASSTSVRRGSSVTLSGSVRPSHPGARVTIQRKLNGTWRSFATVRLSSASTYRYLMKVSVAGTYVLRAFIPAQTNPSVLSGASATRTIKVR
jgi:hypothetical protein